MKDLFELSAYRVGLVSISDWQIVVTIALFPDFIKSYPHEIVTPMLIYGFVLRSKFFLGPKSLWDERRSYPRKTLWFLARTVTLAFFERTDY